MTNFATERSKLIEHLRAEIKSQKVLEIMSRIPRELFVPEESRAMAYEDRPLPIGHGQTISQPFIVALMTEALELSGTEKVLELGTGSGYQAAILSKLARQVITIERVSQLLESANEVFSLLGYPNIEIHLATPDLGWPQEAPYKAIMVTAAAPKIPPALLEQLDIGGRMVIPVGSMYEQELVKVVKHKNTAVTTNLGGCRFVPLIGEGAWS